MSQSDLQAHMEAREMQRQIDEQVLCCVCAECNGPLVAPTGTTHPVCGQNREHKGIKKPRSWSQKFYDGEAVPIHIVNRIKKREKENHGK